MAQWISQILDNPQTGGKQRGDRDACQNQAQQPAPHADSPREQVRKTQTSEGKERGHPLYVSYSRGAQPSPDPLRPDILRRTIPDIDQRTVFVCGPAAMIEGARAALRAAGVPRSRIVYERFGY